MDPLVIAATVLIFALIIVFHEFGHFAAAKLSGMRVHEFAIGFGRPVLFRFKIGETVYAWRPIPLGGFVRIAGLEAEEDVPDGFDKKPLRSRVAVIGSGPVMNFVLAVLLFWLAYGTYGKIVEVLPRIERVLPGGVAQQAGIRAGDVLLSVAGVRGKLWKLQREIERRPRKLTEIVVRRRGKEIKLLAVPSAVDRAEQTKRGYRVVKAGKLGILFAVKKEPIGFFEAVKTGVMATYESTRELIVVIIYTILGRAPLQVAGPVRIVGYLVEEARIEWVRFITFSAMLSLNIGFLNLLPFPALDGARLAFLGLEGIRRKPVDPRKEALVHLVGFVILMGLIVLITYQDVIYLLRKGRL